MRHNQCRWHIDIDPKHERAADPGIALPGQNQHHGRTRETVAPAFVAEGPAAIAQGFAVRPGVDAPASTRHRREGVPAMSVFAELPASERAAFVREASARLDVSPVIVEKDFWVCWMLQRIFQSSAAGAHLVFKGGTSLSKVFGAIKRFSEDIDLSIAPELLGWKESDLDDAPTPTQRRKRLEKLEAACIAKVQEDLQPELEKHPIYLIL